VIYAIHSKNQGFVKPRPNRLGLGAEPPKKEKVIKSQSLPVGRAMKIYEGALVIIKKSGKYYKQRGKISKISDKGRDGKSLKINLNGTNEVC
jgi:hypothetical protein